MDEHDWPEYAAGLEKDIISLKKENAKLRRMLRKQKSIDHDAEYAKWQTVKMMAE